MTKLRNKELCSNLPHVLHKILSDINREKLRSVQLSNLPNVLIYNE